MIFVYNALHNEGLQTFHTNSKSSTVLIINRCIYTQIVIFIIG